MKGLSTGCWQFSKHMIVVGTKLRFRKFFQIFFHNHVRISKSYYLYGKFLVICYVCGIVPSRGKNSWFCRSWTIVLISILPLFLLRRTGTYRIVFVSLTTHTWSTKYSNPSGCFSCVHLMMTFRLYCPVCIHFWWN